MIAAAMLVQHPLGLLVPGAPVGDAWFSNLGVTALLAFLPIVIIACSSFIKISLVLAIVRSALGAANFPPTTVITVLAVVLSMFVMTPVAMDIVAAIEHVSTSAGPADPYGIAGARALFEAASPPLMEFLRLNTPQAEITFFADLAGASGTEPGLRVLLPAFALGEIVEAFLIGFLVYIPFLVIDLIVANTLLALGMHMLSPQAISLPFKLLLFVAVDGWHILLSGLLVSYVA